MPLPAQSEAHAPQPPQVYAPVVTNDPTPQAGWIDTNQGSLGAWSFDDAVTATLTSDPRLCIGRTEIAQAKADYCTSSLLPNPVFETSISALPSHHRAMVGRPPEFVAQVEYPFDWFLFAKRAAEMNSSRLGIAQSQAEYADLIRQRVTETAIAFYDVLEAGSLSAIAREDMEVLSKMEAVIRRGVEMGARAQIELDRVRLDLSKSRQELLEAESCLAIAKSRLWSRLGRTDRDPAFDVWGNLDAPLTVEPFPLAEAFALAQRNRPDLRARQIQVNKAKADTVVEKRKAYPEVSASVGYINQYPGQGMANPDYATSGWQVGLTATVPLFDRNQGNRAKAQAALAQKTHEYRAGMIDLRADVEEADQLFRTAYQKAATIAQEEISLANKVRNSIMDSYQRGGRSLIDVLDAERSYRETCRFYVSSRADYWRAMYLYNSVVGVDSGCNIRSAAY
ncbi:MAG: TolC family protein [Planctomycetaceae bacterium]|nr:TolC family protein [Planctomycetaceae bacterium]